MTVTFSVLRTCHDQCLKRTCAAAATMVLLAGSIALTVAAGGNPPELYALGNWPAPFGIVLVLDRLAALMVLLTSILATVVVLYVITSGWDNRGRHFHALFHFQLMGINGAFLTGDAFNLFVLSAVLLIAPSRLMTPGAGPP